MDDLKKEQADNDFMFLQDSMMTEEEYIRTSYENRKQIILSAVSATEAERTELETRITQERNAQLADLEMSRVSMVTSAGQALFSSLADAAATFGKEQSDAYKALFAASKAFSIAESIMAIQVSISKALSLGFPANIPAMAAVAAEGASIISTISSTQYSGAYDRGGNIPSGKFGLVGERGAEFVKGPATVTGREDTAAMLNQASPNVNIRVVNVQEENAEDYLSSDPGERQVMNILRRNQTAIRGLIT
jgi:hypothetical protein